MSSSRPPEPSTLAPENLGGRTAYDGCLAFLDQQVGQLLDDFQDRGLLENTLVIVTADHGEQFGEHGLIGHGNSLYLPLIHVPLVVSLPGRVPAGRRVPDAVSLADLPATVLDLLRVSGRPTFPGTSLARCWESREGRPAPPGSPIVSEVGAGINTPEHEPVTRGSMQSPILGDYHYILNGDGVEELYDWHRDPGEREDLSGSEQGRAVVPRLRAMAQSASRLQESR